MVFPKYPFAEMTLDEITAQGIVFFIAGKESVSTSTTFTAYFLALHPEWQDRVVTESDKAVSKEELTCDSLQETHYLEASIEEAMRLTSLDPVIMCLCTEDHKYFPEPEKVSPEKFSPENKDSIKPFTYMPFEAAARKSAGSHLVLLRDKTHLACLLSRFRLEVCSDTMIPLRYKPRRLFPFSDCPVVLRAVARRLVPNGARTTS
ncbi:hypothetical protein MRX96_054266 [Rhipicephalus microplus]